jgi:hypothetical protein
MAEDRAKQAIREIGWLKPNEKILVINDGTAAGVAAEYLLSRVIGGLPAKITVKKKISAGESAKNFGRFNRVIIPYSIDDKIEMFLRQMFEGEKLKKSKQELWLVEHLTDEEIEQLLKLKKLKFKQKKKGKLGLLLARLEQRLPRTRFALARASELFRKILEKA